MFIFLHYTSVGIACSVQSEWKMLNEALYCISISSCFCCTLHAMGHPASIRMSAGQKLLQIAHAMELSSTLLWSEWNGRSGYQQWRPFPIPLLGHLTNHQFVPIIHARGWTPRRGRVPFPFSGGVERTRARASTHFQLFTSGQILVMVMESVFQI